MAFATVNIVMRRDKINRKGESPLYIRIIKNRKVSYVATGVSLTVENWDEQASKVKRTYPNSTRLNIALQTKLIKYREEVLKAETKDLKVIGSKIKTIIEENKSYSFFTVANEIAESYRLRGSIGSYDKANSIIAKVKMFAGDKDLIFEELNTRFLTKYEDYLVAEFNNKVNTIGKDMKFIRTVINYAIRQNYITDAINPFKQYKIKTEPTSRTFLNFTEIEKFEEYEGTKLANKCRDICLFQYYAGGIRISDVLLLKVKNIQNNYINITIHKTHSQLTHLLNSKAMNIVSKYLGNKTADDFAFDFLPQDLNVEDAINVDKFISLNTAIINKYLKVIAEKKEIPKNISTHSFRHSFAVNALRKGIRIEEVQKILKHSNIRETLIYARIQNEQIDKALERFGN